MHKEKKGPGLLVAPASRLDALQAAGACVYVAELHEIVDHAVAPNVTPWMSPWAKAGATAIASTISATTVNSTRMCLFMRYPLPRKAGPIAPPVS